MLRSKVTLAVRAGAVRAGFPGDRNAVHDALHAGRRARLFGALPRAAGYFLCAAAIAADLQAVPDGERLRAVFPDCALLPRRGFARRPAGGVHPDRPGDVVSAAGADLRSDRAADPGVCAVAGFEDGAPFRASPTPRPCAAMAATSPTCASRPCILSKICCRSLQADSLPLVAIHIPETGAAQPQGARRTEGASARNAGCASSTMSNAWSATSRADGAVRERCGAAEDDLCSGRLGRRTQGPSARRDCVPGSADNCVCNCAQKFTDRHKLLDPDESHFSGWWTSRCSSGTRKRNRWNAAHHPFTSVHDDDLDKLTAIRRTAAPNPTTWC